MTNNLQKNDDIEIQNEDLLCREQFSLVYIFHNLDFKHNVNSVHDMVQMKYTAAEGTTVRLVNYKDSIRRKKHMRRHIQRVFWEIIQSVAISKSEPEKLKHWMRSNCQTIQSTQISKYCQNSFATRSSKFFTPGTSLFLTVDRLPDKFF